MDNRISQIVSEAREDCQGPQPIGTILAELLAQYQVRFPEAKIVVIETTATAI